MNPVPNNHFLTSLPQNATGFDPSVYYPQTTYPPFQFGTPLRQPVRSGSMDYQEQHQQHQQDVAATAAFQMMAYQQQQQLHQQLQQQDHQRSGSQDTASTSSPSLSAQSAKRGQSKADRRAEHNAIERARRESLNTKFQQLAHTLPNLQNDSRPSKGTIIERTLDFVKHALAKEERYRHEIRELRLANRQLLGQLSHQTIKERASEKSVIDQSDCADLQQQIHHHHHHQQQQQQQQQNHPSFLVSPMHGLQQHKASSASSSASSLSSPSASANMDTIQIPLPLPLPLPISLPISNTNTNTNTGIGTSTSTSTSTWDNSFYNPAFCDGSPLTTGSPMDEPSDDENSLNGEIEDQFCSTNNSTNANSNIHAHRKDSLFIFTFIFIFI
ncbi:hypothetical protein F4703DRAFT_1427733 [Phycomyces blakesleeanus]